MTVAIMQPYFMPYIGYFQLIKAVDKFILYDNIQYTKKGWINRNRILKNGTDAYITIPLEKDSDYLNICDRSVSLNFNRKKLLNQIIDSYRNAPYFKDTYEIIEEIVNTNKRNLFDFIYSSIEVICDYLQIKTEIIPSSRIQIDSTLRGKNKVIKICHALGTDTYINSIGGIALYDKKEFEQNGIELKFLQTESMEYKQFQNKFIPNLSIIDTLMFNSKEQIDEMLYGIELV